MRDLVVNITLPTVRPTLESVHHQFETWRKRRRCRCRIPETLWQALVGLCKEHPVWEVSRALRLNYNGLNDRVLKDRGMVLDIRQHPVLIPANPDSHSGLKADTHSGARRTLRWERSDAGFHDIIRINQGASSFCFFRIDPPFN